jgi:hypothetical protein
MSVAAARIVKLLVILMAEPSLPEPPVALNRRRDVGDRQSGVGRSTPPSSSVMVCVSVYEPFVVHRDRRVQRSGICKRALPVPLGDVTYDQRIV